MDRPSIPNHTDAAARSQTYTLVAAVWLAALGAILVAPYAFDVGNRGEFLIRNTVRLALLYWAAAAAMIIRGASTARLTWTLSCIAYLVHVAMAFEYAHHWSHA